MDDKSTVPAVKTIPNLADTLSGGNTPGGLLSFHPEIIQRAQKLYPLIVRRIQPKCVITLSGGSGSGKTSIASVLGYLLNSDGIKTHILSGDNYPHRIPHYNDAERIGLFRSGGLKTMVEKGKYTEERCTILHQWQKDFSDAEPSHVQGNEWFETYLSGGEKALKEYLGTERELDFEQIENVLKEFKSGKKKIMLRRIGNDLCDLWYDEIDVGSVDVIILEWTHANSTKFSGSDIRIVLESTPEETLMRRVARNRNPFADSAFLKTVLRIEQNLVSAQVKSADIVALLNGEILKGDDE